MSDLTSWRTGRARQQRWLIGGVVIAATIIAISFLSLDSYTVYFYTPSEASAKAPDLTGKVIKVGGMVKPGSLSWKPEDLSLQFVLTDLDGHEIAIQHHGTPPDMFKENSGVVVEGRINENGHQFVAQTLMVKHSEEYKPPEMGHSIDKILLEKSIFKG